MGSNPKTIGKYEIVATIGKGSMGVVFKGLDPLIGRFVAIKTIRPEADGFEEQEIHQRFRREAQAAGRMSHANIVSIYEYGEDASGAFIAMEFVEGKTLAQALAEGRRFDLETIVNIMTGLLSALEYSHKLGVVHRDIKPANIMLTEQGDVKVADFGIAGLESSTLTRTGIMIGTPSYMAPEQLLGQRVDGRVDIFAAGTVFYQLLTGHRPFQGALPSVMHQVVWVNPESPSARNAEVPPGFDEVVAKALAKRPEDRFQSAAAFLAAIRAVVGDRDPTRRVSVGAAIGANRASISAGAKDFVDAQSDRPAQAPPAAPVDVDATVPVPSARPGQGPSGAHGRRRWPLIAGIAGGLVAMVAVGLVVLKQQEPAPAPAAAETKAPSQAAPTAVAAVVESAPSEATARDDMPVVRRKETGVARARRGLSGLRRLPGGGCHRARAVHEHVGPGGAQRAGRGPSPPGGQRRLFVCDGPVRNHPIAVCGVRGRNGTSGQGLLDLRRTVDVPGRSGLALARVRTAGPASGDLRVVARCPGVRELAAQEDRPALSIAEFVGVEARERRRPAPSPRGDGAARDLRAG
jgi:predicted Ser/Thr protein kinase